MNFNECILEYADRRSHLLSATAVHWSVEITDLSNDIYSLEFVTCDWTFSQTCVTDVITVTKRT